MANDAVAESAPRASSHGQTHHVPVRLPFGVRTEAYWALDPTGDALVFVHGFGGAAVTTWMEFPSLLQQEACCRGHDLIFFGYDGLSTRARPSADLLVRFLDALFATPGAIVRASCPTSTRPDTFAYRRILLVGHSIGGIVSRLALLDAHRKQRAWTPRTGLVLFAPAHAGANILPLASLVMGALRLAPVEAFARYRFQVLHDVDEGSQTLVDLADRTRQALAAGATHLRARGVVYAGNDPVVNPTDFCDDPAADFIHNTSHVGVCKPRANFRDPLGYLLKHL